MLITCFHRDFLSQVNRFNRTLFLGNDTCQIKLGDNLLCVPEITSGQEQNLYLFKTKDHAMALFNTEGPSPTYPAMKHERGNNFPN